MLVANQGADELPWNPACFDSISVPYSGVLALFLIFGDFLEFLMIFGDFLQVI